MDIQNLEGLIRVLQASISPVALISGVGLLLLSQTNRFSRVADRLRELTRQRRSMPGPDVMIDSEIAIFAVRARILRLGIGAAVASVLLATLLVLFIFGMAVLNVPVAGFGLLLFAVSLAFLIASLLLFLRDMQLSLKALEEELKR